MQKIGIFDLMAFFWCIAGTRTKEEGSAGLALQVLAYMCERALKAGLEAVAFAADGKGPSFRTLHCPTYKADRKPKDEGQRAELEALIEALGEAGFVVVREVSSGGSSASGGEPTWFEGDDGAAALTAKVRRAGLAAHIYSNDWDLAQLLGIFGGSEGAHVRLFTTKGEERTAEDVLKEFGVGPEKLCELKALAGDGDGYKPFPGPAPGKPGIGDKGAAQLINAFGSAQAALAAAISNLDVTFKEKGLKPSLAPLLRAGGEKGLEMGLACSKLRFDVPVPENLTVGEWDEAEEILRARLPSAEKSMREEGIFVSGAVGAVASRARHDGVSEGSSGLSQDLAKPSLVTDLGKLSETIKKNAEEVRQEEADALKARFGPRTSELLGGRARDDLQDLQGAAFETTFDEPPHPATGAANLIEGLAQFGQGSVRHEEIPPLDDILRANRVAERAKPVVEEVNRPENVRRAEAMRRWEATHPAIDEKREQVLMTRAEFWALAGLPAAYACEMITLPGEPLASYILLAFEALRAGDVRPTADGALFLGLVAKGAANGFRYLADVARGIAFDEVFEAPLSPLAESLKQCPRFTDFADYGRPLARSK